jgi:hypothetical protein
MLAQLKEDAVPATDTMTILRAAGSQNMTKIWRADGTISPYDNAKNFRIRDVTLTSIRGLFKLISMLANDPHSCAIRGKFIGAAKAQEVAPPEMAGHYWRVTELYEEVPHHWLLTDVDGYRPEGIDPCKQPEAAVDQYISRCLPECFQGVSYIWQLSASAGAPGKEGVLKVHLWFWLKTPYTGSQLTAWARAKAVDLDPSVLRNIQPNFTAAPVFEDGVSDPVENRIGFQEGWAGDEVELLISSEILESTRAVRTDSDLDLVDPREKPGLIGLFCRTYSIEEVMERWLPDVFEFQEGSERRLNFLQGGGSPGGAFVSDCREYIVNMHNTDPMQGRATNKWDLVRHYVLGDKDDGADPLELAVISSRPSHLAMVDLVAGLSEIKAAQRALKAEAAGTWTEKVGSAADQFELREVADAIKREKGLDVVALEQLAGMLQEKFKGFGIKVGIATARELVGRAGKRIGVPSGSAPDWAKTWSFVTDGDFFFDLRTKEKVSERGFNAMHNRNMKPFMDPITGMVPSASSYALNEWHLPCVAHTTYMPPAGAVFEMLDTTWANTYRPESVPHADDSWKVEGSDGWRAVEIVKAHLRKLLPNRRERRLFASWLAHNVRFPGKKIRWAPYLHGYEGDGKSFFLTLLGAVMGDRQVRSVSGSTLESNFTDWAIGYAVIGIEEMKQHNHNRYEVMNRLKPFITNGEVEIHPKGKASYTCPNVSNYLIFSNYLDGAPIDENSRRYMFLSSAIHVDELPKLNESGYFAALFGCRTQGAALRGWLLDLEIESEFDPDGRAPMTEIRKTVVEMSRTETESLARDAIEYGIEGVCGTALSSAHLTGYIKDKIGDDAEVGTHKVNSLLTRLGFKLYGKKKWRGDHRKIWTKGPDRFWSEIKKELDATIGKEIDFSEDGDD